MAKAEPVRIPPEKIAAARNGLELWTSMLRGAQAAGDILALVDGAQGTLDAIPGLKSDAEKALTGLLAKVDAAHTRVIESELRAVEAEKRSAERQRTAVAKAEAAEAAVERQLLEVTTASDQALAEVNSRRQAREDEWERRTALEEAAATARLAALRAQVEALERKLERMNAQREEIEANARAALGMR